MVTLKYDGLNVQHILDYSKRNQYITSVLRIALEPFPHLQQCEGMHY